jgi:sialate O-acetylesterase
MFYFAGNTSFRIVSRIKSRLAILALALAAAGICVAKEPATAVEPVRAASPDKSVSLASIFSDHMVLQRDMRVPIWGQAKPGAKVEVKLDGAAKETTADADGKWKVTLDSLPAGGPHELSVSSGDEHLNLTDVMVGEVWIASGQSNMEWPLSKAKDAEKEIAAADLPDIRFIDVPNQTANHPRASFKTKGWQACKPDNVGGFSAVAFFFARNLHDNLHVPIGLIGCNWGGTRMEAWTSEEALSASPTFAPAVKAADSPLADPAAQAARKNNPNELSALFNGMVSTVVPYGIRGVIWYQGEANAGKHDQYAELSKLMIADWRNRWGQGEFPFLLVQLAAFEPGGESWPFLREAQFRTLETPNTGMAVAIDIGEQKDIHPKNKQDVGARLALAARAVAYGEKVEYSGPVYREMKPEGRAIRIAFDHVGGGLEAKGELKGFQVAGADGKYVPAEAKIEGSDVVVSSKEVADPQAVRYDWSAFPDGTLYNTDGLPAVPFRTDKQPGPVAK